MEEEVSVKVVFPSGHGVHSVTFPLDEYVPQKEKLNYNILVVCVTSQNTAI